LILAKFSPVLLDAMRQRYSYASLSKGASESASVWIWYQVGRWGK